MAYGYFDEESKEYVITEPLVPRPWINYLSNTRIGAFVSQGAGGMAWFHQPVSRRISRYDFLGLPVDRPGFYVYVRESDGSYWNPSFQPCQRPLDKWQCRQGMGYTRFLAEHKGICAELTLFVPPEDDVLVWDLTLTNKRKRKEELFVANYLEFSLYEYYKEIIGWIVLRNHIRFCYDQQLNAVKYDYFVWEAEYTNPVFLSTNIKAAGYDCDRDRFIGRGRSTANPVAIEKGLLSNSELPSGGLGIASLGHKTVLKSGQSRRFVWTLGATETWQQADQLIHKYQNLSSVDVAFAELQTEWRNRLSVFLAELPDTEMQNMVNTWNPYGAYTTFFRDRDISSELTGINAGLKFRDTTQNCMSMCHLRPELAHDRLELLMRYQNADGSASADAFLPGSKVTPQMEEPRCDNPVWLPMTAYAYLAETGDFNFLDQVIPYHDHGTGTVYEHLMQGLRQIARDSGDNGLPLLKGRDWDDHVAVFSEEGAESVMTGQNWCYAARLMTEISELKQRWQDKEWIEGQIARYSAALNGPAWDGQWYRQILFRGDKIPLGSSRRQENKIYGNTQAWAIIAGIADKQRSILCMDKMREHLATEEGIKFLTPPYTGLPEPEDPLSSSGPGLCENGGIFVQANCWAIMAEAMLGRSQYAYEYYHRLLPPVLSRHVGADVYLNEPYMYSSHIVADPSSRKGMANLSWLTGTVNWMYIVATQHILGIQPTLKGLRIKPCIPNEWSGFQVSRKFRGAMYEIEVQNEQRSDEPLVIQNGTRLEGTLLHVAPKGDRIKIKVLI